MAFVWPAVPYYGLECPWCSWRTSDGRRFSEPIIALQETGDMRIGRALRRHLVALARDFNPTVASGDVSAVVLMKPAFAPLANPSGFGSHYGNLLKSWMEITAYKLHRGSCRPNLGSMQPQAHSARVRSRRCCEINWRPGCAGNPGHAPHQ